MVTALIFAPSGRLEALGQTLAALVPGVTTGTVADAVVIARERDAEVEAVADFAGATLVLIEEGADPWAAGARLARRELVLCLEAGDVLEGGWREALDRFAATSPGRLGRFGRRGLKPASRLVPALEWALGARRPRPGDVMPRGLASGGPFRPALRPVGVKARIVRPPAREY